MVFGLICMEINHTGALKPVWGDSAPPRSFDSQNIPALLGLTFKNISDKPEEEEMDPVDETEFSDCGSIMSEGKPTNKIVSSIKQIPIL